MANMYAVDLSGEAIQFDGFWASCPSSGSSDALQNACSQGTCSSHTPTSSCSSKFDSLCSSVKLQVDTCTDYIYTYIHTTCSTFASVGSDNAYVVNCRVFFVFNSPSPSPSPSPAGECDRCAYLVGEQCSGLSGKPCTDCAFSNRFSWVSTAKLAEQIEATSSDVIGYSMVSYAVTPYADKLWRAMLSFLSRAAECGMHVAGVSFAGERLLHGRSVCLIPMNKASTEHPSQ